MSNWDGMHGARARVGETRGAYKVLVGKPEGKRPPGRPDLQETGWRARAGQIWLRRGTNGGLLQTQ
jgi:hypothetical protein